MLNNITYGYGHGVGDGVGFGDGFGFGDGQSINKYSIMVSGAYKE